METESSNDESEFSDSASGSDSGSEAGDDDESEGNVYFFIIFRSIFSTDLVQGEDWDELERKAAKCNVFLHHMIMILCS